MFRRVALVIALLGGIAISIQAAPETPLPGVSNVDINWSGAGTTWGNVTFPICSTYFETAGSLTDGRFTASYTAGGGPYGGDSYGTWLLANVAGGGYIMFQTQRLEYGYTNGGALEPGGQWSYNWVYIEGDNSTANMTMRTFSQAVFHPFSGVDTSVVDHTYGWPTGGSGVHNFVVNEATTYEIMKRVVASDGDWVEAYAFGSGSAVLDCGESKAHRDSAAFATRAGYNFGWNQDFTGVGSGTFVVTGVGNNEVVKPLGFSVSGPVTFSAATFDSTGIHNYGDGTPGSAFLQMSASWVNGSWSITNHGMVAK